MNVPEAKARVELEPKPRTRYNKTFLCKSS